MLNYNYCKLCPRECGIDRSKGEYGFCGMPAVPKLGKAMLHFGEEPVITGKKGAGAVFFSGCTLRCSYCQNYDISSAGFGKETEKLRDIFENLVEKGAECIDLVTPTQFLPSIIPALEPKLPIPVVYNCGGYEKIETLQELDGLIDIYMPDLKYADNELAEKFSNAHNYFEIACRAIKEMYRQTGPYVIENGIMKKGVIIRHLVLPGCLENTLKVIDWVSENFPKNGVLFSLMSQYVPMNEVKPPLDRTITQDEYDGALSWLEFCGLESGFTQEFSSATTELLPNFDAGGIL